MHGRRLATTEEVVCLTSDPDDDALETLESWTTTHGVDLTVHEVGADLERDYADTEALGVSVGGDGTFLEGIRVFAPRQIPLLGINAGTLAFLARVGPDNVEDAMAEVVRGHATVYDRQQVQVAGAGLDAVGINEVMIEAVPPEDPVDRKIARLQVFVDGEYVGQYDGTGLAVSTPTGSTGVALSAGGPVHYPKDNLTLQITPLQTHSMGARPIVVGEDSEVTVVPESPVNVFVDGGRHYETADDGDVLQITGADDRAHIVRTSYDDAFMSALAGKLGWGLRDAEAGRSVPGDDGEAEPFLERARRVARGAAESAGEMLTELRGRAGVQVKTDKSDIVTEADFRADDIIRTAIESEFPGHSVRSEESDPREEDGEYTWLIDPVDGTSNFAHGNPNYSISIALLDGDDRPVVGVVHSPETGATYHAVRDGGAYQNETPISVTDHDRLDESMLLSGYDPDGRFLQQFYQQTRGVRRVGSVALNLSFVAAGNADAAWEYDTYPWDVAAGLVIFEEAGGVATDADDQPYEFELDADEEHKPLLASNGALHSQLLERLDQ